MTFHYYFLRKIGRIAYFPCDVALSQFGWVRAHLEMPASLLSHSSIQCRPTRKKHLFQLRLKSYYRSHNELNEWMSYVGIFSYFPPTRTARFPTYFRHFLSFHRANCTFSYHHRYNFLPCPTTKICTTRGKRTYLPDTRDTELEKPANTESLLHCCSVRADKVYP